MKLHYSLKMACQVVHPTEQDPRAVIQFFGVEGSLPKFIGGYVPCVVLHVYGFHIFQMAGSKGQKFQD